ncbi:Rieske (2Fe-2S) protein [Devosia lacusdianchii]|uniref:Rieske (2Fe-2S) protein n=1 Tax=Devosia lacusdianchii TaxID=2917991 RepID=UPI001F056ADB|nr:Rieske 2Fe-2S domain-containing protein [Devosia sp. JXJ CY 41]
MPSTLAPDVRADSYPLVDLVEGVVRSTELEVGGKRYPVLLLRRSGKVQAFLNACPHQYLPLDFQGNNLLSADGSMLMCSMHGAMFTIDNGECVNGPCAGANLTAIAVHEENDRLKLDAVLW